MPRPVSANRQAEIVHMARMIQAKIARDGTRPTHFVRNSLPKLRKILHNVIRRAIKDPG